ncbi:MAG: hypothetical protein JNM59_01325 [Hyphomonadaceae bacterium]|nr:hypothetical protein [Hyphomonadaceae bacterium]
MSDWTLCIDFGTAFSKAAAAPTGAWSGFDPQTVRPLMLSGHEQQTNPFLLDSAVFVDDARILFGRAALGQAAASSDKRRLPLRSFKTLLSVSDLDRALATNAPTSVDPHRIFQMRDLIVLYLAFLLQTVERAAKADPALARVKEIRRRYAAPAWRSGDSAGMHTAVLGIFGEAEAFRAAMGDRLLAPEGLPIDVITSALPKAAPAAKPYEMDLIFEATAAASYTSIGLEDAGSHLIVVDMGAGTTDIAAIARAGQTAFELPEARVTFKQAGDFIDGVIANVVLDSAKWARSPEQKTALWTALMRQMRDIKETVFADGRAALRHEGRTLSLSMRDIERDNDFKEFIKGFERAYAQSLAVVRDDAKARGRPEVHAIAVGGGAAAPFVRALIAAKPKGGGPRVAARPATPDWAHAPSFQGNLAPVFPQLAIAIGGALAPDDMLAARAPSIPA